MTSVSVVVPCYKYGHFLEEAVTSLLDDQKGVDVRVLIIDDASPDDSADVARKIAARDSRVDVIVHETNMGNIATFNHGLLEWADGDYCALVSADDRVTPGALRRARDLLDANPDVGFVYGHALWVMHGAQLPAARERVRGWSVWPGHWWLERLFRQGENPITSPEVIMRTSVLHRVGGFDPRLPHAADMELWLRLAANSDVGFLRGVDQAYYRLHQENMRKGYSRLADLRERRAVYDTVLDRYGEGLPDAQSLSQAMRRQLGREALWEAGRAYGLGRAEQASVAELTAFAADCWPDVSRHPLYRTLRSHRRIGPRSAGFMLTHKGQWWLRRRSWKLRGY
jgi:glycosyltransferase involved in cell wall biosynthesis